MVGDPKNVSIWLIQYDQMTWIGNLLLVLISIDKLRILKKKIFGDPIFDSYHWMAKVVPYLLNQISFFFNQKKTSMFFSFNQPIYLKFSLFMNQLARNNIIFKTKNEIKTFFKCLLLLLFYNMIEKIGNFYLFCRRRLIVIIIETRLIERVTKTNV